MITETDWAYVDIATGVSGGDLFIITPYVNTIHITLKSGWHLVHAKHDGADEQGDIEALKMLCLYRYNKGETQ